MPPPVISGVTFGGPIAAPTIPGILAWQTHPGVAFTYTYVYGWRAKTSRYCNGTVYPGQSPSTDGNVSGTNVITACGPPMTLSFDIAIPFGGIGLSWSTSSAIDTNVDDYAFGGSVEIFRTLAGGTTYYSIGGGTGNGWGSGGSDAQIVGSGILPFPVTQNEAYYVTADTRCTVNVTAMELECDTGIVTITGTSLANVVAVTLTDPNANSVVITNLDINSGDITFTIPLPALNGTYCATATTALGSYGTICAVFSCAIPPSPAVDPRDGCVPSFPNY